VDRRAFLHGVTAAAALTSLGPPLHARAEDTAEQAMARAATAFLGALDARRQRRAVFAFTDAERSNWHYVPRRREGVPFKDMSAGGRAAAHDLMRASLSAAGYAKAADVIRLEGVLRQLETFGGFTRDPDNYLVTVFGTPGPGAPWGWRLAHYQMGPRHG
jgi:hypothetical protein